MDGVGSTPEVSVIPIDPYGAGVRKPSWTRVEPLTPNASCKNPDATASAEKPKQINKAESSADSLLALTSMALQHATNNKKRTEG